MIEFAGYMMPVQYTGVIQEHINVRERVGIFDISHMGEVVVEGPDAKAFLQKVYGGSLKLLITNFVNDDTLTPKEIEELKSIGDTHNLQTLVYTFTSIPSELFSKNKSHARLFTLEEKIAAFEKTGIDILVLMDFDKNVVQLHNLILKKCGHREN